MKKLAFLDWLIPIVMLLAATIVFLTTNLDLTIEGRFFDDTNGWVHRHAQPWRSLHEFGWIPAWIVVGASLAVLLASIWVRQTVPYRKMALLFIIVVAVGPGLIVNVILKDHWGRPRPRNCQEFSGEKPFLKVWQKGVSGEGRSFPSGDASIGFVLLTPFFALRRRAKKWAVAFLIVGLLYGSLLGYARMLQGAHFPSDVVWACGLIYLTALGVSRALHLHREECLKTPQLL